MGQNDGEILMNFLKYIFLILVVAFFAKNSFATPQYSNEYWSIEKKYNYKKDNYQYRLELMTCSDSGNYYCSAMLGQIYFDEGEYTLAYPLLFKSTDVHASLFDSNYSLGYMFGNGLGVLQNYDKAIHYSEKSARNGNAEGAYNTAVYYSYKAHILQHDLTRSQNDVNHNLTRQYAWFKISMALGKKNSTLKNGKEEPMLTGIEEMKKSLAKRSQLNSADKLASEICSSIPGCIQ